MRDQLFIRLSKLNPASVLVALVVGAALFAAARYYGKESGEEFAGWILAALTFALRGEKSGADAAEHNDGTDAHDPAGGRGATAKATFDVAVSNAKLDILMAWAKGGREIDDASEVKAELYALEVVERSRRSKPLPDAASESDITTEPPKG